MQMMLRTALKQHANGARMLANRYTVPPEATHALLEHITSVVQEGENRLNYVLHEKFHRSSVKDVRKIPGNRLKQRHEIVRVKRKLMRLLTPKA